MVTQLADCWQLVELFVSGIVSLGGDAFQNNILRRFQESFLLEQQTLMKRLLLEQERFQEEKLTFAIQRDSDLARIRQEAISVEEQMHVAESAQIPSASSLCAAYTNVVQA